MVIAKALECSAGRSNCPQLSNCPLTEETEVIAQTSNTWFDAIELNHDMIAIIGNRGSGKSALADILALAGETSRREDFSFLDKKKFLAANFEVTATLEDGTQTVHNLQDDPDPNRPETINSYAPCSLKLTGERRPGGKIQRFLTPHRHKPVRT
jgi:ATPase subunit of ABC transporter with duplicated ATPase domains